MQQPIKRFVMRMVTFSLFLTACGVNQISDTLSAPSSTSTNTSISSATPTMAFTSTPTPTSIGGLSGFLLFTNEHFEYAMNGQEIQSDLLLANLSNGMGKVIAYQAKIADYLSHPYYDNRYIISPDATKFLVEVCVKDASYGCATKSYIVTLDLASVVEISAKKWSSIREWAWSPDGKKLAGIAVDEKGFHRALYVINSGGDQLLEFKSIIESFSWNADGSAIYINNGVVNGRRDLQLIDINSQKNKKIQIDTVDETSFISCIQPSPDGESVGFALSPVNNTAHHELYIASIDFTDVKKIAEFDGGYCWRTQWSPDQNYISISTASLLDDDSPINYVFEIRTGKTILLPPNIEVCNWTPNNLLSFMSNHGFQIMDVARPNSETESIRYISGCPIAWLPENYSSPIIRASQIHLPTCSPDEIISDTQDDVLSPYIDITRVITSLGGVARNGKDIKVILELRDIPEDIEKEAKTGYWSINIDLDNNKNTGVQQRGIETQIIITKGPHVANGKADMGYYAFLQSDTGTRNVDLTIDPISNTLTIQTFIIGLTPSSRISVSSSLLDGEGFDHVCESK